jgi:hypothetical protein
LTRSADSWLPQRDIDTIEAALRTAMWPLVSGVAFILKICIFFFFFFDEHFWGPVQGSASQYFFFYMLGWSSASRQRERQSWIAICILFYPQVPATALFILVHP